MNLLFLITLALWAIPQCSFEAVALQQQLLASADSQMLASLLAAAELAGGNRYDGGDEAAADLPQLSSQEEIDKMAETRQRQTCHNATSDPARHIGRIKMHLNAAHQSFKHVVKMANITQQTSISNIAFGYSHSNKDTYRQESHQTSIHNEFNYAVNKTNQMQSSITKGIASHVEAVRQKLASFFESTSYVVHSDVSDEASMWCRRPLTPAEKNTLNEEIAKQSAAADAADAAAKAAGHAGKGKGKSKQKQKLTSCDRMATKKSECHV